MNEQYKPHYFQSGEVGKSYLTVEWTNQHGCGNKDADDTNFVDCHLVMQYKCESTAGVRDFPMRNGFDVSTPDFQAINPNNFNSEDYNEKESRKAQSEGPNGVNDAPDNQRGRHESWEYYDSCRIRSRNHNLFKADQNVGQQAINTRQNRGGQRRGYECPEERDYYPYWHPSEWTDIAILTDNPATCDGPNGNDGLIAENRKPKGECIEEYQSTNPGVYKHASRWNNEADCVERGGQWYEFYDYKNILDQITSSADCTSVGTGIDSADLIWGYPKRFGVERHQLPEEKCLVLPDALDCKQAPWTRANHLGNGIGGDHVQVRILS